MNYDAFVGQVQHRARLGTSGDAVRATRATLETLAGCITPGKTAALAAQLPKEIAIFLRRPADATTMTMPLSHFLESISRREGVDVARAAYHARMVITVLEEAVSPGEIADICAQLPPAYGRLFGEAAKAG